MSSREKENCPRKKKRRGPLLGRGRAAWRALAPAPGWAELGRDLLLMLGWEWAVARCWSTGPNETVRTEENGDSKRIVASSSTSSAPARE